MEKEGSGRAGRVILIVEDEPGVRLFIHAVLARNGYAPIAADSARDALRIASTHPTTIEMVVSDVMLPDMDGRALVETLRARRPALPAVLISGYPLADPDSGPGELRLDKPFRAQELLELIQRALGTPAGRPNLPPKTPPHQACRVEPVQ